MHYWKGEFDVTKRGRQLPLNTGHEHMGTVDKLGAGVTRDSAGQPLREGDRVIYRYFIPCGRCPACLRRHFRSCPTRQSNWAVTCDVWPHFLIRTRTQYPYDKILSHTFPLDRINDAFREREDGHITRGAIAPN